MYVTGPATQAGSMSTRPHEHRHAHRLTHLLADTRNLCYVLILLTWLSGAIESALRPTSCTGVPRITCIVVRKPHPKRAQAVEATDGVLSHSNHFLTQHLADREMRPEPNGSTILRLERMRGMAASALKEWGPCRSLACLHAEGKIGL